METTDRKPVVCDWCGHEMVCRITRRGLVESGKCSISHKSWFHCEKCGANTPVVHCIEGKCADAEAAAYAAATKRYEPQLKPMILEEVRSAGTDDDGYTPVWIEYNDGSEIKANVINPYGKLHYLYNRTWRCWARKPTDDERKAAPWQNENE